MAEELECAHYAEVIIPTRFHIQLYKKNTPAENYFSEIMGKSPLLRGVATRAYMQDLYQ